MIGHDMPVRPGAPSPILETVMRNRKYPLPGLAAVLRERRGVAMVEFAIVLPVLVLLLLPLVDLGMGFYVKTQVMTAAEAGAQYAFVHGWSGTNTTTQTSLVAAVNSATSLSGLQVTTAPSLSCKCANGTTLTTLTVTAPYSQSTCSAQTCVTSPPAGAYVTVHAQATYTPLFTYRIFGGGKTLTASSTVRVQ